MILNRLTLITSFSLIFCSQSVLSGDPKEQSFESGGTTISFSVAGTDSPVVLLPGFSRTQEDWVRVGVQGLLSQDFQVIGFDARGHGKSGKPHSPSRYGVEMVHDVVRLMDRLEIEQAHIVGYSMGGFIALKMATLHPERVSSLVLGGAGWIDAQWEELGAGWESQAGELEADVGATGDNDPLALAAV